MYIFFLFLIVNHHLIESIYNFHSDVQTNSISTQVNFINDINKFDKSIQTDSILISSTEVKHKFNRKKILLFSFF